MLVFFSDIHLTDGTSGETINAGAFDLFADHVAELARKRRAREVRLVLLGDGLDVIRSSRWLDDRDGPRPWNPRDSEQEALTLGILQATLKANDEAISYLRDLPRRVAMQTSLTADQVRLDYALGNHDWLINRYESTRSLVVDRLGLPDTYIAEGFPWQFLSGHGEYDVVARHGDLYDGMNYDAAAGRDASSLGDAIVVELLSRFPLEVGQALAGDAARDEVVRRLKEIDNVLPLTLVPAWVAEAVGNLTLGGPQYARAAQAALDICVSDFLVNSVYRQYARRQFSWPARYYLDRLLKELRHGNITVLDALARAYRRISDGLRVVRHGAAWSSWAGRALAERDADGQPPRFVVYGHTHQPETVALGPSPRDGRDRFYLNCGTWRSVWQEAQTADRSRYFTAWKVMAYVAIYSREEGGGKHEFEFWGGNLRDQPGR